MLGLFSRKLSAPELTADIEELLIQVGRLEERLAAGHRKKRLKTPEAELNKELARLRQKVLEAKAAISKQRLEIRDQPTALGDPRIENGKSAENVSPLAKPNSPEIKRTVVRDEDRQAIKPMPASFADKIVPARKEPTPSLALSPLLPSGSPRRHTFEEIPKRESGPPKTPDLPADQAGLKFEIRNSARRGEPSPRFRHSAESLASELHPKTNEDSLLLLPELGAAAVFDGVSAASLAAEASLRAGRHVERSLKAIPNLPPAEKLPALLGTVLESANDLLWRINQANKTNELATTATLAIVTTYQGRPAVAYASVGDSRLSLWHTATKRYEVAALDDHLLRLLLAPPSGRPPWVASILATHQMPASFQVSPIEMVKLAKVLDGLADPAQGSPVAQILFAERNLVTQSLGLPRLTPHVGLVTASPGDRVLLATDGVHDNLTESEIIELLAATPLSEAAAALVVRAHEVAGSSAPRAKKDDITAIVLEII